MEETQEVAYFGKTDFRNRERIFGIKRPDRRQHMYVVGQTGTGKSTLLKNMALQDIRSGHGVCIVDPHGEFVEEVLEKIPPERVDDVIYFNPADAEYPIGFNVLEMPSSSPEYKNLAASSLMGIFTKIWANVWSARMEYILNNTILALLDTPGTSLMGVMRVLVDKEYRRKIIDNVKDPIVRAFWIQEYEQYDPKFRNEAIAPIQNKVGQFLSNAMIRNIVGQPKSTINIYDIMNQQKILLVNVSKGRIGEDNSALLGAMMITKVQLAAMERIHIPEEDRKDFYLYVDEFQNFATDSFASILSEARKYRLNLIIAHQYIGQLVTDTSTKVRDAVFGNVGTMLSFRVGAADAEFLEKEFAPEFNIQDLVNLPNRRIYVKLMVDNVRSRPFSAATLKPINMDELPNTVEKVIGASRKKYSRSRTEVEKEIADWSEISYDKRPSVTVLGRGGSRFSGSPSRGPDTRPRGGDRDTREEKINTAANTTPPIREYHAPSPAVAVSKEEREHAPKDRVSRPPLRMGEFVVKENAPEKVISLSQLAKPKHPPISMKETGGVTRSTQEDRERKREMNKDALRKALSNIRKKEEPSTTSKKEDAGETKQSSADNPTAKKRGSSVKPGEVVKFD